MAITKPRKERKPRATPLPSAVREGDWRIQETHQEAWVDLKDEVLGVPLGLDAASWAKRAHEYGHIKWTPKSLRPNGHPDIAPTLIQGCEDVRINHRNLMTGVDYRHVEIAHDIPDDKFIERLKTSPIEAAAVYLSAYGCGDNHRITSLIKQAYSPEIAAFIINESGRAAYEITKRRKPGLKSMLDQARHLSRVFEWMTDDPDEPTPPDNPGDKSGPSDRELIEGTARLIRDAGEAFHEYEGDIGTNPEGAAGSKSPIWAGIRIVRPSLPRQLPSKIRAKRLAPTNTGGVFRYPQRWTNNEKDVFTTKKTRPGGGTVLIDASGSMHLSDAQILAIMTALPGALIATYCGNQGSLGTAEPYGELRIIAKDGKRAEERDLTERAFGENMVDGPALRWLAAQPGPRFWVSDGIVTGIDPVSKQLSHRTFGGKARGALAADAAHLCLRHRILRVDDVDRLIADHLSPEVMNHR